MSELRNCWKLVIAILVLILCSFAIGLAALTVTPESQKLAESFYYGCANMGQMLVKKEEHPVVQRNCQRLAYQYQQTIEQKQK